MFLWMCLSPRECEAVGLFQWKEFAAAAFNSSLTLYKTQQDTNMNVRAHGLSHLIKCLNALTQQ